MNPYLSVIITGRNDGYGENFLLRLNTFLKSLDNQVKYHPNLLEIILVEWNPPEENPLLSNVVHVPENCELRIITVPKEIHDLYDAETPMLEYAAKNVGIVRAKGEFVLTTNPDILFSDFLINLINEKQLDANIVYRTDRYDYDGTGIDSIDVNGFVQYAVNKTFQAQVSIQGGSATIPIPDNFSKSIFLLPGSTEVKTPHTNACGDFILASKNAFMKVQGVWEKQIIPKEYNAFFDLPENEINKIHSHFDSISLFRMYANGFGQSFIPAPYCIFHMDHKRQPIKDRYDLKFIKKLVEYIPNNDFWGHQNKKFNEVILQNRKQFMSQTILEFMINKTLLGQGDSDKHTMSLFGITLGLKPKRILELGVREGHTTLPLLYASKLCSSILHSVDIDQTTFNCPDELKTNWIFFKADALQYLEETVKQNLKYDLIYIDDWHSYDHVKKELELIDKISDPGTVIMLHDLMYSNYQPNYHCNLNDPDPQWANGGPYRAVAELPSDQWEYATLPVNHGLTILRKRGNVLP